MKKINKRVPGNLPPPAKSELDGKIADLTSKTISELLELKDRQQKLLNNKSFLYKLPDKGAKIEALHNKIVSELKSKQQVLDTCRLLDNLNLNSQSIQQVEWVGKIEKNKVTYLDSDDDSDPEDVLNILSQRTAQEKKIKILPPDKPLVTPEDLVKIGELPHIKYIVDKTENKTESKIPGQFKPYKTTRSDVHDPAKEIHRNKHKHWEVTAATPPPIIHSPAKVLSIEDSLNLQKEHNMRLIEISAQHAAEKLATLTGIKMAKLPEDTSKFGCYREADSDESEASDPEGSDKEIHDEEPDSGGVVFTVMK